MTTPNDPKARVVEMVSDRDKANLQYLLEGGAPEPETVQEFADRLDSEGLLRKAPDTSRIPENLKDDPWVLQLVDAWDGRVASAKVVPSLGQIVDVLTLSKRQHFKDVIDSKTSGLSEEQYQAQAIRNHLLTLGYKDNADLLAAQAEVARLREALRLIAGNASDEPNARQCAQFAREALAPKAPS